MQTRNNGMQAPVSVRPSLSEREGDTESTVRRSAEQAKAPIRLQPATRTIIRKEIMLSAITRNLVRAATLSLLLLPLAIPAPAQQEPTHRLILKDGSYQIVTKYEVKGNRVRYYSSEREEWEELPNSLVDWPATEKYEKDRLAGASAPEAVQLDKEIEEEDKREEAKLPLVAPGLRLPEDSGLFMLDNFQGEAQVVELQQTESDINRNTKGNIFHGALNPIAGLKQTIELDGAHAKIQAHVDVPSIYINVNDTSAPPDPTSKHADSNDKPQQPQQPQQAMVPFDRFRIVHTDVKSNKRIVGDVKRQVTGKISQEQHFVKTTITHVSGGWLKLTPIEPLPPGEYALIETMGDEGMNLDVWDFGVNPKAPANANPWKPEAKSDAKPATKPDAKPVTQPPPTPDK
jgi:hypothetical protein